MGAFESFLNTMAGVIGGGEDPKDSKPSKKVYTSQDQITKDNTALRDLLFRQGAPSYLVNNSVVARKVGDPIPQYEHPNGIMPDNQSRQTTLPNGVSVNDVFQTRDGQYGYMHPQQGTFVAVEPNAIFSKYKK
jgi:hypothetical protein